jgi:hypothetical protein
VAPLTEHVIEMLPTAPAGPPTLTRALSSPAIRGAEAGGGEELRAALERGLRAASEASGAKDEPEDEWLEDTPSLGELEEALAQMLEEEEWVLELERKAVELRGGGEEAPAARREDEQEAMKRVNTFMALSALTGAED